MSYHYERKHCNLQRHGSLTPIYLYTHRMTFVLLSTKSHTHNLIMMM